MELFIFVGTLSHSFGPIEDVASMPHLSVYGMLRYGYIQTDFSDYKVPFVQFKKREKHP